MAEQLPVPRSKASLPPEVPPGQVRDTARDFGQAREAVRWLSAQGAGDMAVRLATCVHCTGASAAEALETAAEFFRQSPHAELHAVAWSRSPGHRDGVWEYTAVLTVSFPDERGEHSGPVHHGPHW